VTTLSIIYRIRAARIFFNSIFVNSFSSLTVSRRALHPTIVYSAVRDSRFRRVQPVYVGHALKGRGRDVHGLMSCVVSYCDVNARHCINASRRWDTAGLRACVDDTMSTLIVRHSIPTGATCQPAAMWLWSGWRCVSLTPLTRGICVHSTAMTSCL